MLIAYIDGGARGNPGPAGYGVRIEDGSGNLVEEISSAIGVATNNVAEYNGLVAALQYALDTGEKTLLIRSDSELLVKQMRGEYRVRNAGLQSLHQAAQRLVARLDSVTFEHVRRAHNAEADRLANRAMDQAQASRQ